MTPGIGRFDARRAVQSFSSNSKILQDEIHAIEKSIIEEILLGGRNVVVENTVMTRNTFLNTFEFSVVQNTSDMIVQGFDLQNTPEINDFVVVSGNDQLPLPLVHQQIYQVSSIVQSSPNTHTLKLKPLPEYFTQTVSEIVFTTTGTGSRFIRRATSGDVYQRAANDYLNLPGGRTYRLLIEAVQRYFSDSGYRIERQDKQNGLTFRWKIGW
jgi:hypothetical protein